MYVKKIPKREKKTKNTLKETIIIYIHIKVKNSIKERHFLSKQLENN